ncbi:mechanosensitive ion channel family protein [Tsuneonella sp. HG222]
MIADLQSRIEPWAWDAGTALLAGVGGVLLGLLVHRALFGVLFRLAKRNQTETDDVIIAAMERPARWAMGTFGLVLAARAVPALNAVWDRFAGLVMPLLLGWIAYALVKGLSQALILRAGRHEDLASARSHQTRVTILARTALLVIVVVTAGLMLMSIPGVRAVGTTLLASAGLAALAVGAAAQPALKSLIAGLQMAITEPLRIGDLVVIDGHTGRVEEIRMSFVTVRTWDERVVLVPTVRFLDNSFENWSRDSERLSGPVFLRLDPKAEVAPIRAEFLRFVGEHPLWDKRTATVFMTDAQPDWVELRLAMSAATISALFELRSAVREHMVDWLREEQPNALIQRSVPNAP